MKITFHGAAGEVTGSQHLLEWGDYKVLLDCGFFQGHRLESYHRNKKFHFSPSDLDAVILSHAHADHCGNLPGLYRAGFRGPVFCTAATLDVANIMLRDSAHIQQEDARYLKRHIKDVNKRKHPPIEPLYDEDDVRKVIKEFVPLSYNDWHQLSDNFKIRLRDSGHILGSAIVEMDITDKGETRRVVFTGDLGRRDMPLLKDPFPVEGCDVLITESTYGSRVHPPVADIKSSLLEITKQAMEKSGRVIIPAFSLGRTQQVIYFLNELAHEGLLPDIPVFVDSPLATRITSVYRDHQSLLDGSAQQILQHDNDLFTFPGLRYIETQQQSIGLNRLREPFVVIAASGMCENGRVRHHLKHAIPDDRNTILIIGYQARNTLGRRLVEKQPDIYIFDKKLPLRAEVKKLNGLSAHADVEDFKWWFSKLASRGGIGQAFLVHGEPDSAQALASILRDYTNEEPIIPELHQSFDIS